MVRYARRRAGLTQRGLSQRSGVPQETIARIERGANPRFDTLERLLHACGYTLEIQPRLGIGIDRAGIRQLLALSEPERARVAATSDDNVLRARGVARPA